jgi:hypothetical protein
MRGDEGDESVVEDERGVDTPEPFVKAMLVTAKNENIYSGLLPSLLILFLPYTMLRIEQFMLRITSSVTHVIHGPEIRGTTTRCHGPPLGAMYMKYMY